MELIAFKKHFFSALSEIYPETEIQSFFNILIEFKLHLKRIDAALQPSFEIETTALDFLKKATSDLKSQIPIQYIIGETEFYGLPFYVNKNVLIPRPETEELVAWIINDRKAEDSKNSIKILDIGTGSGCIPISLAKNIPNAEVSSIDISSEAIKTAEKNATLNNVDIQFMEADILNTSNLPYIVDVIVSNPPYVREIEKQEMQKNVLEYEPQLALFVEDENPLLFYDKIADLAKNYLSKNGQLYFEINQYLGKETVELLKTKGFTTIELKKDLFGVDRMIKASFNNS
ncbi:release factor glutamine methyltransferase [Lutibacter agarilyticus]|uniref:Release factor glutamine methyltransferase n=1 Tax=Lutibacter agarilyticus TaxID=1109740 RepID=A0A238WZR0_9FLAO|nr:peptide chain release factor N(5)-glutamine methyltransferase [Lutibacter agarilyticus]SNR51861.1 release factor glutamine methyltransferase [Lutibacter agarilyticus]